MNRSVHNHLSQVGEGLSLFDEDEIQAVIDLLKIVKKMGGMVWTIGNGGSAATASHVANDLTKMARVKSICISDMVPTVTAFGNDLGWAMMYGHTVASVYNPDKDCLVGFSCGGNSENIVRALDLACSLGGTAICLTGLSNESAVNKIEGLALIHARVPDIRVQEDLHSIICHAIVRALQEEG